MQYSSKTGGFAPADFLLQIIGLKIDYNQLLLAKSELFEGRNSKNGEINVFLDCFQLILMGFLTTSLHKNSQNDVKLLETWWFWHILGKGTHIYSNQKHPDFHQKSPWTPKSQLSPVCAVGLDMRWTLFHKAAVKGHLEICQTIMWSLEISNFTNFHPRDDKGLTSLHQAA